MKQSSASKCEKSPFKMTLKNVSGPMEHRNLRTNENAETMSTVTISKNRHYTLGDTGKTPVA